MRSWTVFLCVLLSALYGTHELQCNYCMDISRSPDCTQPERVDCSPSHSHCLSMELRSPAYGAIRRCADSKDCSSIDSRPKHLVDANCCDTDLCN